MLENLLFADAIMFSVAKCLLHHGQELTENLNNAIHTQVFLYALRMFTPVPRFIELVTIYYEENLHAVTTTAPSSPQFNQASLRSSQGS